MENQRLISYEKNQLLARKKKFFLLLPLIALPFLTMSFYALGGGKGDKASSKNEKPAQGLNLQLPGSNFKGDKNADKMASYEKADQDSLKLRSEIQNDPYYKLSPSFPDTTNLTENQLNEATKQVESSAKPNVLSESRGLNVSPTNSNGNPDPAADRIMAKLQQLNKALSQKPVDGNNEIEQNKAPDLNIYDRQFGNDVDRLQRMIRLNGSASGDDSEMRQLSSIMDKIIKVQHPENVEDKKNAQQLNDLPKPVLISGMATGDTNHNGFFSLDNTMETIKENAVEASVYETQELVSGSIIKLQLLGDLYVKDAKIASGNFLFGVANLNGERLEIEINSIRKGNSIYPVKVEVYDLDGLPGIYVPGAITRDVLKQSADNSFQSMQLTTIDPSIKAQAAAAGINTVKTLLGRKIKQVKVTIKTGYRVLLRNKNANN